MDEPFLTQRQRGILKAIITEFIESSEPIGSSELVKRHGFNFSPATMRNEMAVLTEKGLLQKDHVSAGRVPTPQAFRLFIKEMMVERELPVVNEVAIKQRLWEQKGDISLLLREAAHALADELQNLSMIVTDEGRVYTAGAAHILRHPEFYDIDLTRTVLHLIDKYDVIRAILGQMTDDAEFGVMLGDEIGLQSMRQCGMVVGMINLPRNHHGHIAVVGPYRLDYPSIVPTVHYLQNTINELLRNW